MMIPGFAKTLLLAPLLLLAGAPDTWAAADADELTDLVNAFLSAADERTAHQAFWADDLVYTSSSGTRVDKAEILSGFSEGDAAAEAPTIVYSAEDIDVRVYDDAAVVAFRLVGTPTDGSPALYYFNTGTFLKRGGVWQAVAWQATKIPPTTGGD